jgi:hypothetical protein
VCRWRRFPRRCLARAYRSRYQRLRGGREGVSMASFSPVACRGWWGGGVGWRWVGLERGGMVSWFRHFVFSLQAKNVD